MMVALSIVRYLSIMMVALSIVGVSIHNEGGSINSEIFIHNDGGSINFGGVYS